MKNRNLQYLKKKIRPTLIFALLVSISLIYLFAASIQCEWTGVEKIVAVGDLHGDYKNFVKILRGTRLVDKELRWKGGKTHLVQIGDVVDRGPDAKKIYDLLMRLQKEAEEAGGKVHMLIGNHEEINITGISFDYEGYVTLDQFVSFLPEKYKEKKERDFLKKKQKKALKKPGSGSSSDYDLRDYWEEIRYEAHKNINHSARKTYIYNFNKTYGKWILEQNTVIRINDIIFVHGGISEEFSTWKLKDINDQARRELEAFRNSLIFSMPLRLNVRKIVYEPSGPLWYRDLAQKSEEDFKENVNRILHNLDANYMIIAHTPRIIRSMDDMSRFDRRIWIIDTGIADAYGGHLSALIINKGVFDVWPPDLKSK
jgi:predicted MPP superfamily phosphohydrolase